MAFFLILLLLSSSWPCGAYSILTHEELVDICWSDRIRPVLLLQFPAANEADLRLAHAYAYGGCLVQDLGYYPFGNKFFSDLTHYARSGDFVAQLVHDASNLNEYAFALGAVAHYSGDTIGHPLINHAVALSFPKLRAKFGDAVTYEDDPKAHIRTECGFDMTQVAKQRYTSDRYHDFIGFEIAEPLLENAFKETYGLELTDVIGHVGLAIGTFRRAVSLFLPQLTKAALVVHRPELVADPSDSNERRFLYNLSRADYEREWGTDYRQPGLFARFLAFLLRHLPKIGPLKTLDFKVPTTATEELYVRSVNQSLSAYRMGLRSIAGGHPDLPNRDFDTGRPARLGEYQLSDKTYTQWMDKLAEKHRLEEVSPEILENMMRFYSQSAPAPGTRKEQKARDKARAQLNRLSKLNSTRPLQSGLSDQ